MNNLNTLFGFLNGSSITEYLIFQILLYIFLTLSLTVCQKDSDEGRPYEFGFTIDGQQHRHEKKGM